MSNIELLNNTNYQLWRVQVRALLLEKGLYRYTEGTISRDSDTYLSNTSMAAGLIMRQMSPTLLWRYRDDKYTEANVLWKQISDDHYDLTRRTSDKLSELLDHLKLNDYTSFDDYVQAVEVLFEDLKHRYKDLNKMKYLRKGLPQGWLKYIDDLADKPEMAGRAMTTDRFIKELRAYESNKDTNRSSYSGAYSGMKTEKGKDRVNVALIKGEGLKQEEGSAKGDVYIKVGNYSRGDGYFSRGRGTSRGRGGVTRGRGRGRVGRGGIGRGGVARENVAVAGAGEGTVSRTLQHVSTDIRDSLI
ncbi:hypothetical protein EDC01DRAFT_664276 [Geopyxis carbonaria]|nr:hypothetical protein EDC01DRAFT_664276 [Geopyxis carbonaria]